MIIDYKYHNEFDLICLKIKNTIRKVKFGKNVQLIEPVNLFECQIGDSSFVGPFVEIGKNALIERILEFQVTRIFVKW